MQVTATVDEEIVEVIDEFAEKNSRSRSKVIALVLEKWALEQDG